MKLEKLSSFRKRYFHGDPPSANTLKRMIIDGDLSGTVVGGTRYFVKVDHSGDPLFIREQHPATSAQEMLNEWRATSQ